MSTSSHVPKNHPKLIAWKSWKQTDEYKSAKRWALHENHTDGSLWAAFEQGYRAAALYPKITGGE